MYMYTYNSSLYTHMHVDGFGYTLNYFNLFEASIDARLKPQSHRIVRFCDRTIGCELVSYDRLAMFAAISFYNRTLWCILYDWL